MRDEGFGEADVYVSFRQDDGSWGPARNLGPVVNTDAPELSASVTPDGKYLFFHRYLGDGDQQIFWVDAKILDTLRTPQ